ncbi:colanic acid biosynthesis acetyltransferase WcaF [Mycobacteroides abscessus subsp. abscessus]|nr:colanic acid biosynthesis acetyltransferase WcaF [Mycobacteroides abscessus subsp. abscessus]
MILVPHRTRRGATSKGTPLFVEPQASDPELIARKRAVNPNVRIPPKMQWVTDDDGNILKHELPGETLWHRIRDTYAALFYSSVVTHIPFHFIRLGYLRLFGAKIGKGSAINRGTSVWSIPYLVIGDRVSIGFRCVLDARAGIAIGNDVVIASDTHIIAGGHDINHPNFVPAPNPPDPIVIDDHVWIATRAIVLPSLLGRGAVVAAHTVVNKEVPPFGIVGGVPGKIIGQRNPDALHYSGKFKLPFF